MEPTTRPVLWHDLRPTLTDDIFLEKIQNMLEHGIPLHTEREIRSLSLTRPDLLIQELTLLSSVRESVAYKEGTRYATANKLLTDYMGWLIEMSEQCCSEHLSKSPSEIDSTKSNPAPEKIYRLQHDIGPTVGSNVNGKALSHAVPSAQSQSETSTLEPELVKDLTQLTQQFQAIQLKFQVPGHSLYDLEVSKINLEEGSLLSNDGKLSDPVFDGLPPWSSEQNVELSIAAKSGCKAMHDEEPLHSSQSTQEQCSQDAAVMYSPRSLRRVLQTAAAAFHFWADAAGDCAARFGWAIKFLAGRTARARLGRGLAAWYRAVQGRRRRDMLDALLWPRLSDLPRLRAVVRHAGALPVRGSKRLARAGPGGTTGWECAAGGGGFRMRWGYSGHGLAVAVSALQAIDLLTY
jgi:hypothetical protein